MSLAAASGLVRLARFRADGLEKFDATPTGLLNALVPWFAFALVACVLLLLAGEPVQAAADLLASVAGLLMPPVISHALAGFWGRQARWLRYAVAVAWCQWVMPPALMLAILGIVLLAAMGVPEELAQTLGLLALLAYAIALNLFLARRALDLSLWRGAALVGLVNLATAAAVLGPSMLRALLEAAP